MANPSDPAHGGPAPLEVPPGFRATLETTGLRDAHRLRSGRNGSLLADSADGTSGYEIHPARRGEPAAILQVAIALTDETHRMDYAAAPDPGALRWDAALAQVTIDRLGQQAAKMDSTPGSGPKEPSATMTDDGDLYILDSRAGIMYQLTPLRKSF